MKQNAGVPPVWVMGLSNAGFGFFGGFAYFAVLQILAERHVPEATIGAITTATLFPAFAAVFLSPMLDVRFSRRFYATALSAVGALCLTGCLLSLDHLGVLVTLLMIGSASIFLSSNALGGWLSNICSKEVEKRVSAWFNIANSGAAGLTAFLGGELVNHLPIHVAAVTLGAMVFAPTTIFLFMPAPGPDRRLAGESFRQFFSEVAALFRRREVLIALLLFVLPSGSFTLTNLLGGLGGDYKASQQMISMVGGLGAIVTGVVGSLFVPIFVKRFPMRLFYLANGIVGSLFTISLIFLPHLPWIFALAFVGENIFQAIAFTAGFAITFETIGQDNPLAATIFTVLIATANLPIIYMLYADKSAYTVWKIGGSFALDGGAGILVCVLLGLMMLRLRSKEVAA